MSAGPTVVWHPIPHPIRPILRFVGDKAEWARHRFRPLEEIGLLPLGQRTNVWRIVMRRVGQRCPTQDASGTLFSTLFSTLFAPCSGPCSTAPVAASRHPLAVLVLMVSLSVIFHHNRNESFIEFIHGDNCELSAQIYPTKGHKVLFHRSPLEE
jgi:hypothetical protein